MQYGKLKMEMYVGMNKKGFTLVEILAVIVLLSLLVTLAIPGISKLSTNMKKRSLNKKIELIEQGAILWGQNNKSLLNSISNCEVGEDKKYYCYEATLKDLYEDDYISDDQNNGKIVNPLTNIDLLSSTNCKVRIYKKNNRVYAYFGEKTCCLGFKNEKDCKNKDIDPSETEEKTTDESTTTTTKETTTYE